MRQSILVWLLFEEDGEVLLARRTDDGKPFAGQWTLPGDLMPEDESDEETLRRFSREVLGVKVLEEEFVETLYLSDRGRNFVTNVFRVGRYEGELRFRKGAYEEARWVEASDLGDEASFPMPADLRALLGVGDRRPPGVPDNRAAWDAISAMYQLKHRLGTDAAHYGPRMPTENDLRLLGDVRGKRVLEIGCGGGQCSIAFAKQGAIATGIDQSAMQLQYARALAAEEGARVEFLEGDITTLTQVKSASQDAVFSAYALGYVEDIATCVAEVARVLKPGGCFVFSVGHPARAMMSEDDPFRVGRSYWDAYQEWEWGPGSGVWMRDWTRTIEDWVDLVRGAGLVIDRVLEPRMLPEAQDESWDDTYPYEQGSLIPTTLIIKAVKP
ncbi:MAG TPA: methyltransferase domain-containing protein [Dehalococcoidia bacterium]|nr:methyltransferase domain-containing protein [Dehalococcoidia bacterium]